MNLSVHAAATLPAATASFALTQSLENAVGVLVAGIFLDLDHWVEFWHDCGFYLSPAKFMAFGNSGVNTMQLVFLHSLELALPLAWLTAEQGWASLWGGLLMGLLLHLALDYINIMRRFGYRWYGFLLYFFLFRLCWGFSRTRLETLLR